MKSFSNLGIRSTILSPLGSFFVEEQTIFEDLSEYMIGLLLYKDMTEFWPIIVYGHIAGSRVLPLTTVELCAILIYIILLFILISSVLTHFIHGSNIEESVATR